MDFIDESFTNLASYAKKHLPTGEFTNLIAEGIIPGIGGIVIFIPQIAFLFFFISLLEESGYMSRVVFLMDKIMRRYGLSGKSVVPLISGTACAIPAIMSARNIENWKERLITILVTPFTTCSARLPVYAILISLIIPNKKILGFFSLQGLTLMVLYLLGFIMAIVSAIILNKILKFKSKSYFVVEMPSYKIPLLQNVGINVLEKTKAFVYGAGKIILTISIVLWFLGSHGPQDTFGNAEKIINQQVNSTIPKVTPSQIENQVAAYKLENSYIGIIGRSIEPVIKPLGYDWKIGIAIVTSFAAREVFVGTLSTIYSVGNSEEEATIKKRMEAEIKPDGTKIFNFATGISLLLFYAFAMQCVSTLAIVKKETNSWKWPIIQLVFMSGFAYVTALIAYQFLK
jgi:ferrous iron transport protein B